LSQQILKEPKPHQPSKPRSQQHHWGIEGMMGRLLPGTLSPGTLPQRPPVVRKEVSTHGVPKWVPYPDDV